MFDKNYIESQEARLPEPKNKSALAHARAFYHDSRALKEINGTHLQNLSDSIFKMFELQPIPVRFAGTQPFNSRGKTLGIHKSSASGNAIQIYKFTSKRHKVFSPKSAVSTLLHEIQHELDFSLCGLKSSSHTTGFYMRISQLTEMLQ